MKMSELVNALAYELGLWLIIDSQALRSTHGCNACSNTADQTGRAGVQSTL